MQPIEYFKLQAKNLFRDFKTKEPYIDPIDGNSYYKYSPEFFDVDAIVLAFDWDEESFRLSNAQHTIAILAGFAKWTELAKASKAELELGKLLFDHQDKITPDDWEHYKFETEQMNKTTFSAEDWAQIFEEMFVKPAWPEGAEDFRLKKQIKR